MIKVVKVSTETGLEEAFRIRETVYIREQQISREDEFDEFDDSSDHFLAYIDGVPAATARWRSTTDGAKLERFATLSDFRGRGVASKLLERMIEEISDQESIDYLYLNAQVSAMPLYAKYGFVPVGDRFLECDIEHQKMELVRSV